MLQFPPAIELGGMGPSVQVPSQVGPFGPFGFGGMLLGLPHPFGMPGEEQGYVP